MMENASRSLENRVAVVTGATRGIGRAIALELARHGAAVVINYRSSPEAGEATVKEIEEQGGRAAAFQADVSDYLQAQDLVKFAIDTFGNLDIR
jgi:3-oxoacyl-[acyl-carrier protein] reductase